MLAFAWSAALFAGNELRDHPSPYLALHGDDPVAWREWGPRALRAARDADRLMLLSIGYFSCHWCHVMQKESYRDDSIAAFLNRHFVAVKIDRELEPALDARMTEFSRRVTGRAGWPLNVFVTPRGDPVFAVLYMPPARFRQVLERLNELWTGDRERIREVAARAAGTAIAPAGRTLDVPRAARAERVFIAQALALHDDFEGGFGSQNKFPSAPQLEYLLELARRGAERPLLDLLETTLDAMAAQGLYDHLGGGFFRYAVDPGWRVPHFEKMLYDNALLAGVYLRAARVFPEKRYERVAVETLDFMRREMATPSGGLLASFSAVDDEGVEGGYYLWDAAELASLLSAEELRVVRAFCALGASAELAAGHHLRCSRPLTHVARNLGKDHAEVRRMAVGALDRLRLHRRKTRTLPADDKLLAGWNGLALGVFSEAARTLERDDYRQTAFGIAEFLRARLWDGERLLRARDGSRALGNASIEDYAHVARGFWEFALLTGRERHYEIAREVLESAWKRFRVGNGWRMVERSLLTPDAPKELVADGPMPSPTAVLAALAVEAGERFADQSLIEKATDALARGWDVILENAFFHGAHVRAQNRLARYLLKQRAAHGDGVPCEREACRDFRRARR